jgi:hypothetical protein
MGSSAWGLTHLHSNGSVPTLPQLWVVLLAILLPGMSGSMLRARPRRVQPSTP